MKRTILLADDHKMFRDGLKMLFDNHLRFEIVAEASNGTETLQKADECKPDLVVMDVSMPEMNGIEATRRLIAEHPDMRVIILSMHADRRFVQETLKAGASGYLLKDSAFEELLGVIDRVFDGQICLSDEISELVIKEYIGMSRKKEKPEDSNVFSVLSAREREVLQLIAEGKPTRVIAEKLNVSVKTIETHRKQIMDKLDIHSIAELTKYAIREGITPLI